MAQSEAKRKRQAAIPPENENASASEPEKRAFPVVAIGASAGGLEAFSQLLSHLPANSGLAFVLVQHLAPKHESALSELLRRAARIPVNEVRDGMAVQRDHAYVIPPNTNMVITDGVLRLMPRTPATQHMPIDYFMRSLAEDCGDQAIGVILSGTASDGTLGMKAIKAGGGITFAQDEQSAKYHDMPRNAIATGAIDFVLPPEGIARELIRIASHPYLRHPLVPAALEPEHGLLRVFTLLSTAKGVDFTHYKHNTIKRRIRRRMVVHRLQDLAKYIKLLQENRQELDALYHDILIHVTGFFRDPEAFDTLKKRVFPELLKNRPPHSPFRIWVPGCSSGEEAYSLAMVLLEFLGEKASDTEIQIFATDINETALERARVGVYAEHDIEPISPGRLRRFFIKTSGGHQINKSIRDMCVFARQDITTDPPFSRLDLISCRNLLIYLDSSLQKKVLPMLHYALKPTGYLLLGASESISMFAEHFEIIDKKYKIYARKPGTPRLPVDFPRREDWAGTVPDANKTFEPVHAFDVQKEAERVLLARYAPSGVVVNSDMEILHFRGRTGRYLDPAPGQASLILPRMVREGLAVDIRTAVQKARRAEASVKRTGIPFRYDGRYHEVDLEVIPLKGPGAQERYFIVLFSEPPAPKGKKSAEARSKSKRQLAENREMGHLKDELAQTKSALQSIIEEQETTNEELKSANEEVLSANEELQSTNEELETAKEELQSTNEELTTLNEELQNRNSELSNANNDLLNLLASVNLPVVMLGNDLRIRRATPAAEKLLNLIPTDTGRPIGDIKPNLQVARFDELVLDAIDTVTSKEMEVQDREGHWYLMRIKPYKTLDNRIDGAVAMWLDLDAVKIAAVQAVQNASDLVEAAHEPMIILDEHLRVKTANQSFYREFKLDPAQTPGRPIYEIGGGQWDGAELRSVLESLLPKDGWVRDFQLEREFAGMGRRRLLLNARRLESHGSALILLAIADVTGKAGEERLASSPA